ncbi:MAG: NAD(P)/FAD-dependent oxidoreductase [Alphaproteobacteria bacterium]
MTSGSIFAEGFKTTPWWWEWAPPTAEGAVPPPKETEVAIVGSGYGGLTCALELARNGVQAHVLEQESVFGFGASTRNGGGVGFATNLGKGRSGQGSSIEQQLGPERIDAMLVESQESFLHLEQLIQREKIECHYWPTGRFVGAAVPRHYDRLARQAEKLNRKVEGNFRMLPRERQHEQINTDLFYGGLMSERSGRLHPALLHKGIRDAARRAGATMSVNAKMTAVERDGAGFIVRTTAGDIRAREVVATTNGYTGKELGWWRRRLVPVRSYIIATEEMPEERVMALIPNRRTIADTKRVLSYFGMSQDRRRILYGGRASFAGDTPENTARTLHKMMCAVFPELRDVKVTHGWTGYVAFTFDAIPHFGQHDGIHYAMGCNGSGVVNMTWFGTQLGRKIARTQNRPSAFDGVAFPTRPLYTGNPWFLPIIGEWYRFRDRLDRWLA